MATGVASWVISPASANASADQNVNMAEGMAPSLVNDGVRALMSSVAMWRDDMAGVTTTGGATTFAVTSKQGFASLAALNGRRITVIMNVSSAASPTLNVDGTGAVPMRLQTGVNAPAGTFVQGSPYGFLYNGTEFIAFEGNGGVPTGALMPYAGSSAPAGWLLCVGQTASRTGATAALFAVVGTTYGVGDGSTTFTLPDLRGRVIAGIDSNLPGSFANRITVAGGNYDGTVLGNSNGLTQSFLLAQNQLPNVSPAITITDNHYHQFTFASGSGGVTGGSSFSTYALPETGNSRNTSGTASGTSITAAFTNSINGGVTAQQIANLQPTITLNFIIKT